MALYVVVETRNLRATPRLEIQKHKYFVIFFNIFTMTLHTHDITDNNMYDDPKGI